jgi:hypothetical protein
MSRLGNGQDQIVVTASAPAPPSTTLDDYKNLIFARASFDLQVEGEIGDEGEEK